MRVSIASRVVSASTRPLCAGIALTISLLCVLLGYAASNIPATDMTSTTGISSMGDMGVATAAAAAAPVASAMTVDMGGDGGPTMALMCETPCVTDIGGGCTIAAGLAVAAVSLLVLFLASRRNTFLGLLARVGPDFFVRRRQRDPTPWTVPSLTRMCVLRV